MPKDLPACKVLGLLSCDKIIEHVAAKDYAGLAYWLGALRAVSRTAMELQRSEVLWSKQH